MHSKFIDEVKDRRKDYDDVENRTRVMQIDRLKLNEKLWEIESDIRKLKQQRPDKYIIFRKQLNMTMTKMKFNIQPSTLKRNLTKALNKK
jgi:hypothetical protein